MSQRLSVELKCPSTNIEEPDPASCTSGPISARSQANVRCQSRLDPPGRLFEVIRATR